MRQSFRSKTEQTAKKAHHCDYCCQKIDPGVRYVKIAGVWEGDFYTLKGHVDCLGLWLELYDTWASDEGMNSDIAEVFSDAGDIPAAKESMDAARAMFPEAVARIEARCPWLFEPEDDDG